jgi:glutathione reductase (NADPH)
VGEPRLDWAALIDREKQMIRHIPGALGQLMTDRGVDVIRGEAAFAGPNAVRVGDRMIEAEHIVIATGSMLRPLPFAGADCRRRPHDHVRGYPERTDTAA